MSETFGIDLSGWDLGGKASLIAALAQSVDEFVGMVAQSQIVISDPDWPDKRAASHKFVEFLFDAIANFVAEPSTVRAFVAELPENATHEEVQGIFAKLLPDVGKLKDALAWVFDHLDEFMQYVLPFILMFFDKTPKLAPLRNLLSLPRLRAA